MNDSHNQRKIYWLALALLVTAVVLGSAWSLWLKPTGAGVKATPAPDAGASPTQGWASPSGQASVEATPRVESEAVPGGDRQASTIVYYQDNYGYLVPVMCSVPMEDGIAKATLSMMVQSPDNDMQAARLGLRTVLPENTSIDLDIAGGLARIDLGKEVLNMADAAAESNMVEAVVIQRLPQGFIG